MLNRIICSHLKKVIDKFTQDKIRHSCARVKRLIIEDLIVYLKNFHRNRNLSEVKLDKGNVFNNINLNLVESEKSSRFPLFLYESKIVESTEIDKPMVPKVID